MNQFIEINDDIINLSSFAVIEKDVLSIVMRGTGIYKILEFDMTEDRDQEFDRISKVLCE